jgi:YD repeat-containing protein
MAHHHKRDAGLVLLARASQLTVRGGRASRRVGAGLALMIAVSAFAQVTHVYDEAGRLVQSVVGPDGGSVQYSYDPAGNITAVNRYGVNDLSLAEFTPNSGAPASIVTLYGSGFKADVAANTVKFNGKPAIVKDAKVNVLTVKVPAGATTGKITVSNTNGSVTSASDFVVMAGAPAPVINGFVPDIGIPGQVVTIAGGNFQPEPADNKVTFAGAFTSVVKDSDSPTSIKIKAPAPQGMHSGRLSVATPYGTATSVDDYYAVPSTSSPSLFEFKARASVDGPVVPVRVTTAGKSAVVIFDGKQKGSVTLKLANSTFPTLSAEVFGPDGVSVQYCSFPTGSGSCALPALPVQSTYTVLVNPKLSATGSVDLSLTGPTAGGSLQIDAPSPTTATLATDQDITYTFDGTQGQRLHLLISGNTLTANDTNNNTTTFSVARPDGTLLNVFEQSRQDRPGAVMVLGSLPSTGRYSLTVAPSGADAGQVKLHLRTANSGTPLPVEGTKSTVNVPAQEVGYYSLAGMAGDGFKVDLSDFTLTPGATNAVLNASLYDVDGLLVKTCQFKSDASYCDIPPSAAVKTGQFGLVFSPGFPNAASAKASVQRDPELVLDAPSPTTVTVDAVHQARLGFKGTANQPLHLLGTAYSVDDGNPFTVTTSEVIVEDESGAKVTGKTKWTNSKSGFLVPITIPASGNYSVRIVPTAPDKGPATFHLRSPGSATPWPTNGTSAPVSLPALGAAYYSIEAAAGDYFGLATSGLSISPGTQNAVVNLTIYRPDGSMLDTKCELVVSLPYCRLKPQDISTAGRYSLLFSPGDPNSTQFNLAINVQATGRLDVNGTATPANLAAVQTGKYTFTGTVGQRLGLGFAGMSTNPPGSSMFFKVYSPSGTELASAGWGRDNGVTIPQLTETGEYAVVVDVEDMASGTTNLYLSSDVEGSLLVNGPAVPFNVTRPGQNGRFVFSATAGQTVSVVGTDGTFLLDDVSVRAPDGGWVPRLAGKELQPQGTGFVLDLGALPLTGDYELLLDVHEAETGTMNLKAVMDVSSPIAIDGTPTTVNLGPGQNGRFTFSGNVGQNLGLGISNVAITPSGNWPIYRLLDPSGTEIFYNQSNRNYSVDFPTLTVPGVYTFIADPVYDSSLNFTLTLSNDLTGSLVVGADPVTFSTTRPGQNARYTFQATAHQNLNLITTNSTFGGVGGSVWVFDAGGNLVSSSGFNMTLALNDLAAGTYTAVLGANGINVGSVKVQLKTQ